MLKSTWFNAFLSLKRGKSKLKHCYGMLQMPLKAVIFDLDGTLIDSAPDLRTACNKVLAQYGYRPITIEETMTFVGNGAAKLMERAFRASGKAVDVDHGEIDRLTTAFLEFYEGHEADETRIYQGVVPTLHQLQKKNLRLALCTNKPSRPTLNLLKDLGLQDFFDVVVGGDELEHKKPHPQMIFHVLDRMQLSACEAVMVGDSPNDIEAAKQASMLNVAVSYGYRKVSVEELGADIVIDRFCDLPDVLATL